MNTRVALILTLLAGCEAATPAAKGPCGLLTQGEVAAVFPGAKSGEPDASRQKYGITACSWPTARGRFVAQLWKAEGSTALDEARGLMLGVVDPLKHNADANVRYESVAGIGEQAVAVVETKDAQRGILNDIAMLVAIKGDEVVVLIAPELARNDRATALASLKSVAQKTLARL